MKWQQQITVHITNLKLFQRLTILFLMDSSVVAIRYYCCCWPHFKFNRERANNKKKGQPNETVVELKQNIKRSKFKSKR
uniref:Putative secreted protein n=1 Tax=Anopheles darlingi TaxID=43151 RepID=A0A2M4DAV9_ANODA